MTANVVDPGVVNTELYKHVFWVVKVFKWMTAWLLFKVCISFFFPHVLLPYLYVVNAAVSMELNMFRSVL